MATPSPTGETPVPPSQSPLSPDTSLPGEELVFDVEILSAQGLPRPERTYVKICGLGVEEEIPSEALVEESVAPKGWVFKTAEVRAEEARLKAEADAAAAAAAAEQKGKNAAALQAAAAAASTALAESRANSVVPPSPSCQIAWQINTVAERRRARELVRVPLRVLLCRFDDESVQLAEASLDLNTLVHEAGSFELDVELFWSEQLISELQTQFDEQVAAAASAQAEGADPAPAERDAPLEDSLSGLETFKEPSAGRLVIKVSSQGPISRVLRPEDYLIRRNVKLATTARGESYIPAPPPKRPPPSAREELEREASRVIGRLAVDFARMCHEHRFEEPQIVGPGGKLGPHPLLGSHGVRQHMFCQWLQEQSEGTSLKDLGAELRPAIVRLMRAENKDGPACGLCGNENDARYTFLRDYILRYLFRALNRDVENQRSLRDECLWRSPIFDGFDDAAHAQEADDMPAIHDSVSKQDAKLARLAFEFEVLGDIPKAKQLHEDRLSLEHNALSITEWFSYARFLMRCGQNQLEAEHALRFAISLRPAEDGPSFQEVAFMACLLQNHALPSSLDGEGARSTRFEAAKALLASFAEKHMPDRGPLYFLFIIHALEVWGLKSEIATSNGDSAMSDGFADEPANQAILSQIAALSLDAAAYLEMARELREAEISINLVRESPEVVETYVEAARASPEASQGGTAVRKTEASPEPVIAAFADVKSLRRLPDLEDLELLECVDLVLYFGLPNIASFLLTEAVEAYGFLSQATASSERCKLQLIKAALLARNWPGVEDLTSQLFSFKGGDRNPQAHVLLGESRYQAAKEAYPSRLPLEEALSAFHDALSFLPLSDDAKLNGYEAALKTPDASPKDDPVLHLRVASIFQIIAEDSDFQNASIVEKAITHYKRSLMAAPTAEAWKCIAVCCYRRAKQETSKRRRDRMLHEALRYLGEANLLDNERPEINVWSVRCAAELGQKQVAKQALRQVLRFEESLGRALEQQLVQGFIDPPPQEEEDGSDHASLLDDIGEFETVA